MSHSSAARRPHKRAGFAFCTPVRVIHVAALRDAARFARLVLPREVDLRALHDPRADAVAAIVAAIQALDEAGLHCLKVLHGKPGGLTAELAKTLPAECCVQALHRPGVICPCKGERAIRIIWYAV